MRPGRPFQNLLTSIQQQQHQHNQPMTHDVQYTIPASDANNSLQHNPQEVIPSADNNDKLLEMKLRWGVVGAAVGFFLFGSLDPLVSLLAVWLDPYWCGERKR
mmetsp:Transcript_9920/g.24004  ORF Transcript_9920/g.24004 Transcript_9920/m.24004 type:complete len:103 (-) Transcript_9920:430-738(-)